MSDAPNNPDRRWMSGLKGEDIIAFIQCEEEGSKFKPATTPQFFSVQSLLDVAEENTKLGPPKSASEGAERDRTWRSITASSSGLITAIDNENIKTKLSSGRNQTYKLRGMTSYVIVGQEFQGNSEFLAGLPNAKLEMQTRVGDTWEPRSLLESESIVDKYVAAKALGYIGNATDTSHLEALIESNTDSRLALEAAGSLCRLGSDAGYEIIKSAIESSEVAYLPIEAVFILTELARELGDTRKPIELLKWCASNASFEGNEIRQASIWGLGKAGACDFLSLIGFFDNSSEDEVLHAIEGFGNVSSAAVIDTLLRLMAAPSTSERIRAIAMYVLTQKCAAVSVIPQLLAVLEGTPSNERACLIAALGCYAYGELEKAAVPENLRGHVSAVKWLTPEKNWLKKFDKATALSFVAAQDIF